MVIAAPSEARRRSSFTRVSGSAGSCCNRPERQGQRHRGLSGIIPVSPPYSVVAVPLAAMLIEGRVTKDLQSRRLRSADVWAGTFAASRYGLQ
jgi:hypothetical protein